MRVFTVGKYAKNGIFPVGKVAEMRVFPVGKSAQPYKSTKKDVINTSFFTRIQWNHHSWI